MECSFAGDPRRITNWHSAPTMCSNCARQADRYIALRDAARAEQREQIEALEDAITEIADFIPTDQTINIPALVNRAIAASMDRKRA